MCDERVAEHGKTLQWLDAGPIVRVELSNLNLDELGEVSFILEERHLQNYYHNGP